MNDIWKYIEDFLEYKECLGFARKSYKCFLFDFAHLVEDKDNFFFAKHQVDNWCVMRKTELESGFRRRVTAIRKFSKYLYA